MSYNWTVDIGGAKQAARKSNHRKGLPWTDPITGETHLPPAVRKAARKAKKSAKGKGGKRARR